MEDVAKRANRTSVDTVVVGAGQAGLATGYHLSRAKAPFVILEASERIGDSWRRRWDSLRLFTPARYCSIPGTRFPAGPNYFPTKDEMAAYLENYVEIHNLPVRTGTRVERVSRAGDGFLVRTNHDEIEARNVIVAMANYQLPRVPDFARELHDDIRQLHSSEYRNPGQLKPGPTLVVGAGNSGSEISRELARTRPTYLAGKGTGQLPFRIEKPISQALWIPLVLKVAFHRLITVDTPIGRKLRPKLTNQGGPWIRVKNVDLQKVGVKRLPRMTGVKDGLPLMEDGTTLEVANTIWCIGYEPDLSWLDLPIESNGHEPIHDRGVVPGVPGLYFVGLHFQYSLSSAMIHGVGRDALRIAGHIAATKGLQAAGQPAPAGRPAKGAGRGEAARFPSRTPVHGSTPDASAANASRRG